MKQEEKLEEAKRLYQAANADQRYVLESLFPELKESEDEKIRKEIEYIVKTYRDSCIDEGSHNFDACLAWLEKQGDKTVISHKFNKGDWIISKWGGIYQIKEVMSGSYNLLCGGNTEEINSITQVDNNSRLLCISDIKKLEEQVPKPKWTEEDYKRQISITEYLNELYDDNRFSLDELTDLETWLKSLKQRMEE